MANCGEEIQRQIYLWEKRERISVESFFDYDLVKASCEVCVLLYEKVASSGQF